MRFGAGERRKFGQSLGRLPRLGRPTRFACVASSKDDKRHRKSPNARLLHPKTRSAAPHVCPVQDKKVPQGCGNNALEKGARKRTNATMSELEARSSSGWTCVKFWGSLHRVRSMTGHALRRPFPRKFEWSILPLSLRCKM